MAKFIKKPEVVEAITFDEFVQFGRDNGGNIVNGMPWHFTYNGLPVTHCNDELYSIASNNGLFHDITPIDMLITNEYGHTCPMRKEIFDSLYQQVVDNELDSSPNYIFTTPEQLATLIQTSISSFYANEKPLTIDEASDFLNIPKQTLYQFTSTDKIPFTKVGKRLLFLKKDLIEWLKVITPNT